MLSTLQKQTSGHRLDATEGTGLEPVSAFRRGGFQVPEGRWRTVAFGALQIERGVATITRFAPVCTLVRASSARCCQRCCQPEGGPWCLETVRAVLRGKDCDGGTFLPAPLVCRAPGRGTAGAPLREATKG